MNVGFRKIREEACRIGAGFLADFSRSPRQIVRNKIVFSAYGGAGYGCNPKYVAEALLSLQEQHMKNAQAGQTEQENQATRLEQLGRLRNVNPDDQGIYPLDLVWLVREYDATMPHEIRQVKWGSVAAAREWAMAAVWVDNTRTRRHVKKKPEQFYIQTWHGCLSPKPLEAEIEEQLSATYIRGAKQDSQDADLFICNNDFFEERMRTSFWYRGPILRCGLPRNAPLMEQGSGPCSILEQGSGACSTLAQRVRQSLGVPDGVDMCLYAPTFSDNGSVEAAAFNYEQCCAVLEERFGRPFALLVRAHPNVAANSGQLLQTGSIDVSHLGDPIELLCAADVVISDYSSMIEDFALLGRPAFQFVPKLASFKQQRGLCYPLEDRPYPIVHTEEELHRAILEWNEKEWVQKRASFFASVGFADDGQGDQTVARLILDVLEQGKADGLRKWL